MTCWIWASVAPSCITMTIIVVFPSLIRSIYANFNGNPNCRGKAHHCEQPHSALQECLLAQTAKPLHSFPFFATRAIAMHGVPLGGARFVNDPFEQAANGRVGQWPGIVALRVCQHFVFAVWLIQRNLGGLLEFADFEGAL